LTQPAVSRRIQELERELGGPLFSREGRVVMPTALAESCAANAERILAEVSLMRMTASGHGVVEGRIRAGMSEVTALALLDRLIARLSESYPNVVLECDVDLSSRLLGKLARRQLDIAFVPGPVSIPGAVKTPLGSCTLVRMASPGLLGGRRALAPRDVVELPIISLPHDADVHWTMMKWFEEAGVQPRHMSYCNNFSVVVSLVRKGLGISLLPQELLPPRDCVRRAGGATRSAARAPGLFGGLSALRRAPPAAAPRRLCHRAGTVRHRLSPLDGVFELVRRIRLRTSAATLGLPPRERDFQRQ
jgi:DNA-binding transcriptional LysR family regulator